MATRATAKTELFAEWLQGDTVMAVTNQGIATGARFWVRSTVGVNNVGYGCSPDAPFATLDYAISQCVANRGDIIFLMEGHAETISTAALSPGLDIAGVKIVGLGDGATRPTFTFTHVNANIIVSAASCSMYNVLFIVGIDNVVEVIDVDCADFLLEKCEIREGGFQALTLVDITGAGANVCDRVVIRNNRMISEAAGAVNAIEIGAVHDGVVIEDNFISGDFSDAAISSGSICTNILIKNNLIRNINAGDWAIELTAAATGLIVGNRLMANAIATVLDPGSCMCVDNFAVLAIDQTGVPIPVVVGAPWPTGAIAAATFAAAAITAAAIATDAIDADALAADAVDEIWDEVLGGHVTVNTPAQTLAALERCIEKISDVPAATDPLFVIAGGPIEVISLTGIVTTTLVGALNGHLDAEVTTPAASIPLSTNVALDNDVAGTSYSFPAGALPVLTPTTAGALVNWAAEGRHYMPIGTLNAHYSAAGGGGVIKWYLNYRPLSHLSVVTVAP